MIEVKNVSMSFRMSQDRIQSIKEYLVAMAKGKLKYKEFWALKDVSFSVRPGEVLGIIGPQWSGEKHDFEGNFRNSEAHRGCGGGARQYCAHAGVGQRF